MRSLKQDVNIGAFMLKHVDLFVLQFSISLQHYAPLLRATQIRLILFVSGQQTAMIKAEGHSSLSDQLKLALMLCGRIFISSDGRV
jgi:hypothetical protein